MDRRSAPSASVRCSWNAASSVASLHRSGCPVPAISSAPYNAAMTHSAHPAGRPAPVLLSERQRRHLRGLAHALKPVIRLGNAGVTPAVIAETACALETHEL